MQTTIVVIQIVLTVCLVVLIALQRSNADELSNISSSQSAMPNRTASKLRSPLYMPTVVLGLCFAALCIVSSNIAFRNEHRKLVSQKTTATPSKHAKSRVPKD